MKTRLFRIKNQNGESLLFNYQLLRVSFFLLLISSYTSIAVAQTKVWDKTLGGIPYFNLTEEGWGNVSGYSYLKAMVTTPDGGYVLAGYSDSRKGGDKSENTEDQPFFDAHEPNWDFWVVKIDSNGTKVWDRTYNHGKLNPDRLEYQEVLTSIVTTPDGGFLLGGHNYFGGTGNWIIKIDQDGNKIWEKIYESPMRYLTAMLASPDGGFLLLGEHGGVLKIDENGKLIWQNDYTIEQGRVRASTIIPAQDGGYLIAGSSQLDNADSDDFDYWLLKINNNGEKEWHKTFGGSGPDYLAAVVAAPDEGYLLGGTSASDRSGDKSEASKGGLDYWLIKINNNGVKVWDKTFGSGKVDFLTALLPTPDGGYLVSGYSDSDASKDKSEPSQGLTDYWVVKINNSGVALWDKTLGGNYDDLLSAVVATSNNEYVLGGSSRSDKSGAKTENTKGLTDYWVVKIKDKTPLVASAWDRRYGGSEYDNFTDAIKTSDGGYLIGGYTRSVNSGDKSQSSQGQNDYWIVKSDKNGTKLWDKRYGGTQDDYLNRVIQTQDGGYLLGGSTLSGVSGDKTEATRGNRDYWVVKVDVMGNKQWDKRFGGLGYDELKKVVQLSTGEYVLGGYSNSPVSGDKTQGSQGGNDYWLVKISSTGAKLWDKRYGGTLNETLGSFTETREGDLLLGGTSFSGKSGNKSQSNYGGSDYWVVKTDKNGNLLWDRTFGGSGQDDVYSIGRSHGSDFFIAGTSTSGVSGNKSQPNHGGKDYWLIKINSNGGKLWDKSFGSSANDELRASTYTKAGDYVLAGKTFSGASSDKTQTNQGNSDYWVVKVDVHGAKIWDKRYGGSGAEELRTVFQTNDGGLLLGGRSDSGVSGDRTQPSQGGSDYWLVKIAPESAALVATSAVTLVERPMVTAKSVSLNTYPNPFTNHLTVSFTLPETQSVQIKIYNSEGREIATLFRGEAQANHVYELKWQAHNQPTGMYLLQLQTPTKSTQRKLLIK